MNAYYKIYVESNINLVSSLIYKFKAVADSMNRELPLRGIKIPDDPHKWRYYMHLAGDYHSIDTPMEVVSLDTRETIVFSKESLKLHKKTQNVYYNTPRYIDDLIARYPSQSVLIKGIMHPVPMDVSIPATDGTIFYYGEKYVESQEYSLITKLEDSIRRYIRRFMMESYRQTDDLYTAGVVGMLTLYLIKECIDLRNEARRTAEVHSYHIGRYLASHNSLDEFIPYMSKDQMFWLYMNIANVERHTGMQKTFDKLVENLMTARRLPMYDYTLRQKSIDLESELLAPEPVFVRTAINLNTDQLSRTVDEWDIPTVMRKEVPDAIDNGEYLEHYTKEAISLAQDASISNLPTKIVEASAVDPEDTDPIKATEVTVAHWFYMSATNKYINTIDIINPVSGDTIKLDMKQAVVLFVYAFYLGYHGHEMKKIPVIPAMGVAKLRWISDEEYRYSIPDHKFDIWADDIDFFQKTFYELEQPILSADTFLDACDKITTRKRLRYMYANAAHRHSRRGVRKMLFNTSYANIYCHFDNPLYSTYEEFFKYLGIDTDMMYQDTWQDLAMSVFDGSTLFSTKSKMSVRQIQAAMVTIFKRLSSYSVQFLEEIISSDCSGSHAMCVIPDDTDETTWGDATALITDMNTVIETTSHLGYAEASNITVEGTDVNDVVNYEAECQLALQFELVDRTEYKLSVILPMISATAVETTSVPIELSLQRMGRDARNYV